MHINGKDRKLQFLSSPHPPSFWWYKNTKVLNRKKGPEGFRFPISSEAIRVSSLAAATEHVKAAVGEKTRKFHWISKRHLGMSVWILLFNYPCLLLTTLFRACSPASITQVSPNSVRVLCVSLIAVNSVFRVLFCFVLSWFYGAYQFQVSHKHCSREYPWWISTSIPSKVLLFIDHWWIHTAA